MGLKVLMTAKTLAAPGVALLENAGCAVTFLKDDSAAGLADAWRATSYDAVISRTLAVPRDLIESAPSLRIISRHGVGYNNVDIAAATERGIPVMIADGANGQSVAELTIGLLLAAARRIPELDGDIRKKSWDRTKNGVQLSGRTLGIVAFGAIGQRVAAILRAMGMKILAFDPHVTDRAAHDVEWVDTLDALLSRADVVSLHCPLTPETRGMIGAAQLARMKEGAILLNTARGGLIDEPALAAAVLSGHLAGAGLDTFEDEPLAPNHPFRSVAAIVMTPHMGGSTDAALHNVAISAAQNVVDVLTGRTINHRLLVNPAVLDLSTPRTERSAP